MGDWLVYFCPACHAAFGGYKADQPHQVCPVCKTMNVEWERMVV